MNKQKIVCTKCMTSFEEVPKRSFLGFLKFYCPKCSETIIYPLTKGFRIFYWILAISLIANTIQIVSKGGIPIPGLLGLAGIAGIMALLKDYQLKKQPQKEITKTT